MLNQHLLKQFSIGRSLLVLLLVFCANVACDAQEFRVETEVYLGDSRQPVANNVTLFSNGMVYDFQMSLDANPAPKEVVIYDSREKYFVLVDVEKKHYLKLDEIRVFQMLEALKKQTAQSKLTQFLLNEEFVEEVDVVAKVATLKSKSIEYRLEGTQPSQATMLPIYFDFLDQFTKLQATDPTKLPPFPRMKLNLTIKKLGWIPNSVLVRLNQNDLFNSSVQLKSTHTMLPRLSEKDRERIKFAKTAWMAAKSVKLQAYRSFQPRTVVPKAAAPKTEVKAAENAANDK